RRERSGAPCRKPPTERPPRKCLVTVAASGLLERARAGDKRAIARLLSVVENDEPGAADALRTLYPLTGHAEIVGITGPPGGGKSTLVNRLAGAYRATTDRVAVVAVDPSSPFSGGAILGDRIRMRERFLDEGLFIRIMASRGHAGGLARAPSRPRARGPISWSPRSRSTARGRPRVASATHAGGRPRARRSRIYCATRWCAAFAIGSERSGSNAPSGASPSARSIRTRRWTSCSANDRAGPVPHRCGRHRAFGIPAVARGRRARGARRRAGVVGAAAHERGQRRVRH